MLTPPATLPPRTAAQRHRDGALARALLPDLQADGLRRLAITFVNHAGATLVKAVPIARLAAVARDGVGFSPVSDAWTSDGRPDPDHPLAVPDGDLRLVPDLTMVRCLDRDGGWAWAPGIRHERSGAIYPSDQRGFCRQQLQRLRQLGLEVRAGFEIEWLVGERLDDGRWRPALAGGPYGADRLVAGLDYASAIAEALDAAGLPWLQIHPEYGASQLEVSLAPSDPLAAADAMVLVKLLIQRVSQRFGLCCSFSPLPVAGQVGNGGHLHLSLQRHGRPLLQGGDGPGGLTSDGEAVLAGLLEALPALLAIACPLTLSYQRLQPGCWSAPFQVWGVENREAALRLVPTGADQAAANLELKVADPSANPYLLVGAVLAVAAEALHQPRPLPPPVQGDPGRLDPLPSRLPSSLAQASEALAAQPVLRAAMGEPLHASLRASQLAEVRRGQERDGGELLRGARWTAAAIPWRTD